MKLNLDLDDLEKKAKSCESWDWFSENANLYDGSGGDFEILTNEESSFISSMNPQTALGLIRIARAAKSFVNAPIMEEQDPFDDLEKALEVLK